MVAIADRDRRDGVGSATVERLVAAVSQLMFESVGGATVWAAAFLAACPLGERRCLVDVEAVAVVISFPQLPDGARCPRKYRITLA